MNYYFNQHQHEQTGVKHLLWALRLSAPPAFQVTVLLQPGEGLPFDATAAQAETALETIAEAKILHVTRFPDGNLYYTQADGLAETGSVFLWDRQRQTLYHLDFSDTHLSLSPLEFSELASRHNLRAYAEHPAALTHLVRA